MLAFVVLLVGLGWSSPVWSHAALIDSQPADGTVLDKAPRNVDLHFSEAVSPLVLALIDPNGKKITLDQVVQQGTHLRITLPDSVVGSHGAFMLSWRVVSADGHPVGGGLAFSVGSALVVPTQGVSALSDIPRVAAIWASRLLLYLGLFFGIGAAFFRAWIARGGVAPITLTPVLLGLAAVPVSLVLLGLDALDAPWGAVLDPQVWRVAWSTTFAHTLVWASAALCLAGLASRSPEKAAKFLSAFALIALGTALAASGHASDAPPRWLARPAVWLHVVAVAIWVGSLLPLWRLLLVAAPEVGPLRRFSAAIAPILVMLVLSGAVLVWLQFDRPSSLWATAYGKIFLIKMLLVFTLLLLAAHNRWRLTAAVLRGDPSATRGMARAIAVEAVIVLAILATVAAWRFTPPPRVLSVAAMARHALEPVSLQIESARVTAEVILDRRSDGAIRRLELHLMRTDGAPLRAQQVDVDFAAVGAEMAPIRRRASGAGAGVWEIEGLRLPALGRWKLRIEVLVDDFDRLVLEGEVETKP